MEKVVGVNWIGRGFWVAKIRIDGTYYHLLRSPSYESCVKIRLLAEKARDNNTFPQFYERLVTSRNRAYNRT